MLYETITKILNKAKAEMVDLLVARDMLLMGATEEDKVALNEAADVLTGRIYTAITALRKAGDEDTVKELCGYLEAGKTGEVEEILEDLKI